MERAEYIQTLADRLMWGDSLITYPPEEIAEARALLDLLWVQPLAVRATVESRCL